MESRADEAPTERSPRPIRVGEVFADRYRVEALLGRGGMGAVYRVLDIELDEVVALKLLDDTTAATSDDVIERFRREVRLARRVTHRNAARTYDLGEHGGQRFLTMEFVDGQSLRELQEQRRLELVAVLDISRQIAEGLAAAHAAQVVHRDLKPANVLLESGGRVVITDFGIARGLHAEDKTLQTHGTLGTPAYMAPEQLAGDAVGPAADVYALGLVTHELLVGELPYKRDTVMETALARLHESPPDLCVSHAVDPDLSALIALMLSQAPTERPDPGTVALALAEAQAVLARAAEDASELSTPTPIRRLALAVLPFLHRGPADTAYIGEVLADELIDLLAMTKSLRVSASGATARYTDKSARDPREIGESLGVEALVDGTVQVAGERVRISARLLDVNTGFQRWSERFEGSLSDVFELQDKMGRRIAEALRVEVEHSVHRGDATPEAVEHYLRGRQLIRAWRLRGDDGGIAHYARCLALAPSFKPALAAQALALLAVDYFPRQPGDPDWATMAAQAVDLALGWAPELAETHLAAGRYAAQIGDHRGAAKALRLALSIAPTYAAAHEFIGQLQLEGGRVRGGLDHLEQALDLDPSLVQCLPTIARYHALRGEYEPFEACVARYYETDPRPTDIPVRVLEARVARWRGQPEAARVAGHEIERTLPPSSPMLGFTELLWIDVGGSDELRARVERMLPSIPNPRFRALMLQIACEAALLHGHPDLAEAWLEQAGAEALADLDWLEHCPLLDSLQESSAYKGALVTTRARAEAIWWR